ncbi:hypothetical protein GLOTRDRAFT_116969 [Gloeophyllum trabeum ATCC 11539]|uniref:Uncharacterized protein n=1 Tax=Gloeophyllum trabeum (strain ATCC 11539 / FP-39264 / Madison 617) TaxID=670483 RepID=S7RH59_GLOTA|nr:uncharacterized protein GLOTRDRAFT_116969 [Gloeophyllum trabeum ATCC 11539]EPQ53575.1 hypothetical protein GLOTRDRAFT_116969 [Gloeophyllum trabeum ATCC 11539]
MACRRKDRRYLVGCHVGAVALRGCDHDCCPYPRDRWGIIANERLHYTPHTVPRPPHRRGGCKDSYRPKFVCIECRRAFKMCFREEHIYRPSRPGSGFEYAPNLERLEDMEERMVKSTAYRRRASGRVDELERLREEIRSIKALHWDVFWTKLDTLSCPACCVPGIPVGSTFRPPSKKDSKAWAAVKAILEGGEARNGHHFTYCPTRAEEDEAELIEEARRVARRRETEEAWRKERTRRIEILRSSCG